MAIIKIRNYHLDAYQHVNNARYLEFLEEARWRYFDHIYTETFQRLNIAFFIVNININYRLPATMGDVIEIKTETDKIGKTSMVVKQEIFFEDTETLIADAKITFVIIDKKTNKPMVINQELQEVLSMNKIVN